MNRLSSNKSFGSKQIRNEKTYKKNKLKETDFTDLIEEQNSSLQLSVQCVSINSFFLI